MEVIDMKRLIPVIFFFSLFTLKGMDHKVQVPSSVFDRIPAKIAYFMYGVPQFFSVKQQLGTYGIAQDDGKNYEQLDAAVYNELVAFLKKASLDLSQVVITKLNPEMAQDTPGFVVTNGCIFIDQNWWLSITPNAGSSAQEVKRFFSTLIAEQFKNGQYRKHLATKIIVDGVLVSAVIGIMTYTIGPSVCSWVSETVPGTTWLESMSTGITETANQTCSQFYAPSLCMMAGKTAWSSLLAPGVAPCVHAVLTEPVARYLSLQASTKAFDSIINKQALREYCSKMSESDNGAHYEQLLNTLEESDDIIEARNALKEE